METTLFLKQVEQIFHMKREDVEKEFAPYLYTFYNRIFLYQRRLAFYQGFAQHTLDETNSRGKRVLDIGCGFGLFSLYLAAYGAREVVSIDVNEEKIEVFKKILARFDPQPDNIRVFLGDGASLDFEDGYFDAVLAREVLSHAHDTDRFLSEINRVMAKGGFLLLADGNNAFDLPGRRRRRIWWDRTENGPINTATLRGTDLPFPYSEIRRQIIEERYPQLPPEKIQWLAGETAGLWGQQIFDVVDEYQATSRIGHRAAFKYRNPRTGEYPELELNPLGLIRKLGELGFQSRIIPTYWSPTYPSRSKDLFFRTGMKVLRALKPLHLLFSLMIPMFEIRAQKLKDINH